MTIRVDQLVVIIGAVAILAFIAVGGLIVWSFSRSDYSGEFDLSGVTTYEPCLRAPGQCPCLRTRDCAQRLKAFQDHPVFWLGETFESLPLTNVDFADYGEHNGLRRREVSVYYGACIIESGNEGCGIPLTLRMSRFCEAPVNPETIRELDRIEVRGTDAYTARAGSGPGMFVRTSNVTIDIYGVGDAGSAARIASQLVRANGDHPGAPSEPFDPPRDECYAATATP